MKQILWQFGLLPAFFLSMACGDPVERCQGNIEVDCVAEGVCYCAVGAFEGEACIEEANSTDPDACENRCCGAGTQPGPPSVLQGTAE